ncbi:MAG: hypothetical protein QNJ91_03000 [Gammaproteobacteria bacterium]|nr:hypothetical protein [Gammaproteobacteria bacterium]
MKRTPQQSSELTALSTAEIDRVAGAGGIVFGRPQHDPATPGGYTIVPSNGAAPALYAKLFGKWVPLGSEPFIGPAAGELDA